MADIDPEERESILEDLEDLEAMRAVFDPRGYKGVVIVCSECGEDHYYEWEMLKESLEHMLETGEPRMHEPAFEPSPDEYVGWDYARGYLDSLTEADADTMEAPVTPVGSVSGGSVEWLGDRSRCAYCRGRLPQKAWSEWSYCPFCNAALAPLRLVDALLTRGWNEKDIASLMDDCGFEPPLEKGEAP
ncbi:MAG: hypothetical protein NVSMB57_11540 [Actinomycetota bacterium]